MKRIYSSIAKQIESYLELTCKGTSPDNLFRLRKKIEYSKAIDYDIYADSFAKLYWLRNFWKAVYFFEYEYSLMVCKNKKPSLDILVLGSGSATDTIACLAWLNNQKFNYPVHLTLVDRSERQLKMAKKLVKLIKYEFNNINFHVNYRKLVIEKLGFGSDSFDIIIMSHFLTENINGIRNILMESRRLAKDKGDLIIIERDRDPIWQTAMNLLPQMGLSVYETGLTTHKISKNLPGYGLDFNISPHYVRASYPEQGYQADLVYKYFTAWQDQSIDTIKQIFTKNAQYDEKPGVEEKIYGLSGVLNYWEQNPMLQKNINVYVRNIGFGPNNMVCAFEGDFDTPKQHIEIKGAINFGIDHYSRKISQVTEYFNTQKTPFR